MFDNIKNLYNELKKINKEKNRDKTLYTQISKQNREDIQYKKTCREKTLAKLSEAMIDKNEIEIEVDRKFLPYFTDSVINNKIFYGYRFIQLTETNYKVIKVGEDLL